MTSRQGFFFLPYKFVDAFKSVKLGKARIRKLKFIIEWQCQNKNIFWKGNKKREFKIKITKILKKMVHVLSVMLPLVFSRVQKHFSEQFKNSGYKEITQTQD